LQDGTAVASEFELQFSDALRGDEPSVSGGAARADAGSPTEVRAVEADATASDESAVAAVSPNHQAVTPA
jgi:hypothetical protein